MGLGAWSRVRDELVPHTGSCKLNGMRRTLVAAALGLLAACGSRPGSPTAPTPGPATVPIMGASRLSAQQLVAWFNGRQPRPPGTYAATVPLEALVLYYIEEGAAEGVTGDVAFVQSVVETGWFRFAGVVPASANNFAGLGATDSSPSPAIFPGRSYGCAGANPAPARLRRSVSCHVHHAAAPQSLRGPAVCPGVAQRQGADLESDGKRKLGERIDLCEQHPRAVRRSESVQHQDQRRHSGEYRRNRIRSSTLRLSMKTVKTWVSPMKA